MIGLSATVFLKRMGRYWQWLILRYYYDLFVAAASCCVKLHTLPVELQRDSYSAFHTYVASCI